MRMSSRGRRAGSPVAKRGHGDLRSPHKAPVWPAISSILTALTAVCALLISGMTVRMTADAQMTSRYSNAVEQLGSTSPATKLGGVYALGRLALDSHYDRPVVVELLTDYVRSSIGPEAIDPETCAKFRPPPVEIAAALKVLFYSIRREPADKPIDLSGTCLVGAKLPGADLTCVRLDNAMTDGADFAGANFTDASMQNADLMDSAFTSANFTRADLSGAKFGGTNGSQSSQMTRSVFLEADLTAAQLIDIDLSQADFTRALLTRADLRNSTFAGARMGTYLGDARNLPPTIDRSGALPLPPSRSASECAE